jgi:hypothetical protein
MRLRAVALAVVTLAGCGSSEDGDSASPQPGGAEVRASVQRLYAAAAAQNGAAMCRTLTPDWRRRLDRGGGCAGQALQAVLGPGPPRNARVSAVTVTGESARAEAEAIRGHGAAERTDRAAVELRRVRGRWLVAEVEML